MLSDQRSRVGREAMTSSRAMRNPGVREELATASPNELAIRWREHHDQAARQELCERFLPLARRLAGRYRGGQEPFEDLLQVASVGLLAAIDRFDPERGASFASFALPTMLGEIKRHFRNTGWSVHVPRGAQEMALRVERAAREITSNTGRAAQVSDLAEYLEISTEDVLVGLEAGMAHYADSLDAPLRGAESEEESKLLADTLGGEDERFDSVEFELSWAAALTRLPTMERRALTLRVQHNMKQVEVARELGCSQMHVSRLLRRAAATMRALTDPDPGRVIRSG